MTFCPLGHRFPPIKQGLNGEETDRLIRSSHHLKYRRNMFKNSAEIFAYIKKEDVKLIDVRFTDLPGIQHHFNVPVESFDEAVFTEGLMFDGSSIRGFQSIHESDMKLLPVPSSAFIDPFRDQKTLVILFSVHNPVDNSAYSRDPRGVVAKAVEYMRSLGFADTAFFAPEAEFYVFDSVRFKTGINEAYHDFTKHVLEAGSHVLLHNYANP